MERERERAGDFNMESQDVLQENAEMTEKKSEFWHLKLLHNLKLFPRLS